MSKYAAKKQTINPQQSTPMPQVKPAWPHPEGLLGGSTQQQSTPSAPTNVAAPFTDLRDDVNTAAGQQNVKEDRQLPHPVAQPAGASPSPQATQESFAFVDAAAIAAADRVIGEQPCYKD